MLSLIMFPRGGPGDPEPAPAPTLPREEPVGIVIRPGPARKPAGERPRPSLAMA